MLIFNHIDQQLLAILYEFVAVEFIDLILRFFAYLPYTREYYMHEICM